jgi:hypothetical protein
MKVDPARTRAARWGAFTARRVKDSQRVIRHQRHRAGPGRIGAAARPPVIEPDDTVRRSQPGDGAMPHPSSVGVAHDKQDRVARPALVPPDPRPEAAGERHGLPLHDGDHRRLTIDR